MTAALIAWRPSVQDVANVLANRTGAENIAGVLTPQGTFTASTVPTATQVESLVRGVQSEVVAAVGDMPDELAEIPTGGTIGESPAGHVVTLGAAALVESQFYPDRQLGVSSPTGLLEERYRIALAALAKAVEAIGAGADPGDSPQPKASFPATVSYGLATTPWEQW